MIYLTTLRIPIVPKAGRMPSYCYALAHHESELQQLRDWLHVEPKRCVDYMGLSALRLTPSEAQKAQELGAVVGDDAWILRLLFDGPLGDLQWQRFAAYWGKPTEFGCTTPSESSMTQFRS